MKKSHIFYVFVLIFALSVYYFDYHKGEENKKKKDEASVLIPFLKDQINKIELKRSAEEIQLVKDDKGWRVVKPLEDLADENSISDWLNSLTSEKTLEVLGEGEKVNWIDYGLDKPKATLIIFKTSGEKVQIELSPRKNFEGNSFLRKDQGPLVMVASASWPAYLEKTAKDLRDKRILRTPMTEVESANFIQSKNSLFLEVKEGLWFIKDKVSLKLSQNAIREVINAVSEMRAQEFAVENDPNEKEMIDFGLKSPLLKVELKFKGNKSWIAEFGQNKDKTWFAWVKDLHKVLKIENNQINKIVKASEDSLRDRETPFVFKKDEVKKISIQVANQPSKSFELSREGEKWKSNKPGLADDNAISGFLNRLSELRIDEFLDGKSKVQGLEPISRTKIILNDSEGKMIWSMAIGDSFKKKIEKIDKQYYFVKTSAYSDVVALADSSIGSLLFDKLIKSENSKSEKPIDYDVEDTDGP
jgi:hypothetical protein